MAREQHRELLIYARVLTRNEEQSRDLVQDSFVAAWQHMDRFDVSKDVGPWLRGILRNKWKEFLRKASRQVALDDDGLEALESEMLGWQELRRDGGPGVFVKLEGCLEKLPEGLSAPVQQFYYEEMNSEEAAESLEIASGTLRKRLERARQALRDCLAK